MGDFDFLLNSKAGIRWGYREDAGGGATLISQQEVAPILEQNKAMATHNDGYSKSRELARVATIPISIIYKWLHEEGWYAFDKDPETRRKLAQKLDSSEYRYLKTSDIILGDSWRHQI